MTTDLDLPDNNLEPTLPPDDWAHTFFTAYLGPIGIGTLTKSARHAGVSRTTVAQRLKTDGRFNALMTLANQELLEALEAEAYKRAKDGLERPVYQRGQVVGAIQDVDNKHLQWLLERLAPEKYHLPTRIELTRPDHESDFTFHMGETPEDTTETPAEKP